MNTPVNFELAKLLKEKGFDKRTTANWWILAKDHSENYKKCLPYDESKIFFAANETKYSDIVDIDGEKYHNAYHVLSAPTISDVVMWLYEKHGIWISVGIDTVFNKGKFCILLYKNRGLSLEHFPIENDKFSPYNSPKEAYEAAIEYTLTNLI